MEQLGNETQELETLQHDVDLGEALLRLQKNRDFKKLVIDLFLEDGAKMLTQNLWKIKHRPNSNMDIINDGYMARSMFYGFMEDVMNNANSSKLALRDIAEEEAELKKQQEKEL